MAERSDAVGCSCACRVQSMQSLLASRSDYGKTLQKIRRGRGTGRVVMDTRVNFRSPLRRSVALVTAYAVALQVMFRLSPSRRHMCRALLHSRSAARTAPMHRRSRCRLRPVRPALPLIAARRAVPTGSRSPDPGRRSPRRMPCRNATRRQRRSHARGRILRALRPSADVSSWWSMIFSENRYPLFGIML